MIPVIGQVVVLNSVPKDLMLDFKIDCTVAKGSFSSSLSYLKALACRLQMICLEDPLKPLSVVSKQTYFHQY
jgi:hypothetical protein